MKRARLWSALALLLAVNVVVLIGVLRNRLGPPDAELTLTEREVPLQIGGNREENSGLSLALAWRRDFVPEWFDAAKLTALGFAPPTGAMKRRGWDLYRRLPLPKKVFVVLEYEGAAWRRYREGQQKALADLRKKTPKNKKEAEQIKRREKSIEGDLLARSRLFAVDAGRDPARLRSRYPDRSRDLIVPALARMTYGWEKKVVTAHGEIVRLLVDKLHLTRDQAAQLIALPTRGRLYRYGFNYWVPGKNPAPRYEATVRWGRRHEPWVVGVRVIEKRGESDAERR